MFKNVDVQDTLYFARTPSYRKIVKAQNVYLSSLWDKGFPYANAKSEAKWVDSSTFVLLHSIENASQSTQIDSIALPSLRKDFLYSLLRFKPGEVYSRSRNQFRLKQLKEFPFLILSPTYHLQSIYPYTILEYKARSLRFNSFSGLVSLLPNANPTNGQEKRFYLLGTVDLRLQNLFSSGKSFTFKWQSLGPLSQMLQINASIPDVARTGLSLGASVDFFKQDTSFTSFSRSVNAAVLTQKMGRFALEFSKQSRAKHLLSPTDSLGTTELLELGLAFRLNSLDNLYHPKAGTLLSFSTHAGSKTVQNQDQTNTSMSSLRWSISVLHYAALGTKSLMYFRGTAASLHSPVLFTNELFRLGGVQHLRGFFENQFFARQYFSASCEYRIFFEEFSYFFGFVDGACMRALAAPFHFPFSLGFGISLENKGSRLQLAFAMGQSSYLQQYLSLSQLRVHLGYQALF